MKSGMEGSCLRLSGKQEGFREREREKKDAQDEGKAWASTAQTFSAMMEMFYNLCDLVR